MAETNLQCGLVLLAAGASTRMGMAKQLLKFDGVSLIRRAVLESISAGCDPIVVVLGAHRELIEPELASLPVIVADNLEWPLGISRSISCGLKSLVAHSANIDAAFFMLCDQPHITGQHLLSLAKKLCETDANIVAANYGGEPGAPALFRKKYFPELLELSGQSGAKSLLKKYKHEIAVVEIPEGIIDLDTQADLENLHLAPN